MYLMEENFTSKCAYNYMQINTILKYGIKKVFQNHVCNVIIMCLFWSSMFMHLNMFIA